MKLQHFVGVYVDMDAVNIAFPSGGNDGDYLIVDNEIKGWNPYSGGQGGAWETPTVEEKAPVRKTDQVYGDLDVHHDLRVGGKLSAQLIRGRNAFLGLFDTENDLPKHPRVGEWAMVFAYTSTPANTEEETPAESEQTQEPASNAETSSENTETRRTENELCIGYIFICKEDGVWTNTGYKGGYQSGLFEAIQTVQDNVDEEATARRSADAAINAKIPAEANEGNKLADKKYVDDKIAALDADVSQEAGADGLALRVTEVDGKVTQITGSIAMDDTPTQNSTKAVKSGGAKHYVDNSIAALDADVSQEAGADGLALRVTEVDGKVTQITGSIAMDDTPTQNNTKAVKSGGVHAAIKTEHDDRIDWQNREVQLRYSVDQTLQNKIDAEETRAQRVEGELGDAIETIKSKIPSAASSGNKLADKAYVDDKVSDERSRALSAESALQGDVSSLGSTLSTEAARITALTGRVVDVENVIPQAASPTNKLTDENSVNDKISTATATFRGTYNLVTDFQPPIPVNATRAEIAYRLGLKIIDADNNDYAFVLIPNTAGEPSEILRVERYKYNGSNWAFEFELNNSSFTTAQWDAINSGITTEVRETMQADIAANKAKISALAGGLKASLFINPSVIYRNESQTILLEGHTYNTTSSAEMVLYDGSQEIERSTGTLITKSLTLMLDAASKTYTVVSLVRGMSLSADATVYARYPIYYGFAASASALAASVLNRYDPTTSAAHTYNAQNGADGQHFYILVPSDISALTSFTMNGAPFVMAASTEVINGITYKVYTSGNTYNAGTQVTVVAS